MLYKADRFTTNYIASLTGRSWCTINHIIESDFDLDSYKKIIAKARETKKAKKAQIKKSLTFRPFNANKSTKVVTVRELPDNAENVVNSASDVDNMLNDIWEHQQDEAKQLVRKAEKDEAIHKIRNGLQKISEGLGELL